MKYTPKEVPPESINNSNESACSFLLRTLPVLIVIFIFLYLLSLFIPQVLTALTPRSIESKIGNFIFSEKFEKATTPLDEKTSKLWALLNDSVSESIKDKGVYLISSDEENAFALPGGKVFLTKEFVANAESDNEKLFVMAHELGHQEHRHPLKSFYGNIFGAFLNSLSAGSGGFSHLMISTTGLSFSRDQEKEADLYALDLVQKVSGTVKGAFNFFKRMHEKQGILEKLGGAGGILSTHPMSEDRIEYLEAECKQKFGEKVCS